VAACVQRPKLSACAFPAKRTVIDRPFAPTQEQIAGYWLWEVKSIDEAVERIKRCPNPMLVDSEIEIRPEFEAADFAQ
jgi:hypothetical protein